MKIKHLKASGLKSGKTAIDHPLAPVTIFCGPNFSGKTARLDAIRLGLVGHLPELGKQSGSTMGLAANGRIGVELEFDTAKLGLRKTWTRSAKGKIVTTSDGYDVEIPPVLMDSNEYFSLGDKDRVRYVFGLATVEAPEETVNSIVAKTKMLRFDPSTPAHESVIAGLVDQIMASDRKRHDEEQAVQDWIEALIAEHRDALKLARQSADRMIKTVQGITQIKAVEDEGLLRDCEARIAAQEAEIGRLTARRAILMAEAESFRKDQQTKRELEARLAAAGDRTAEIEKLRNSIAAEEARLTELRSQAPAVGEPSAETVRLRGEVASQESELRRLNEQALPADLPADRPGDRTAAVKEERSAALIELDRSIRDLERYGASLEEARKQQADHLAMKCCPTCGHKGAKWRELIETEDAAAICRLEGVVMAEKGRIKAVEASLADIGARLKAEEALSSEYAKQIARQAQAKSAHYRRIKEQGWMTDQTRQSLARAEMKDRQAYDFCLREHKSSIYQRESSIKTLKTQLAAIEESAKAAAADRTRLADLTGPDYVRLTADKLEAANGVENEWQSAVAWRSLLQAWQSAFAADQQDAKRQAQARLAADEATARVEVLAALVKMLEALQVAMVEEAFKPLIAAANRVTEGILPSALAFHDGELGRWAGSTWVSHQTFSGTEKALAYAGLSVALAKDSPIKIVLLDEMGRMEVANCERVVERLLLMIEGGYIDQAVLVDVDAGRYRPIEALNKSVSIIEI